jgi:hypothetical protein
MMKCVAIIQRRLKPGKTYDDYRKAWFHTKGFGVPTDMYTVINAFDPQEIISIGIMQLPLEQVPHVLQIDVTERLKNPLDDVIEQTIIRHFGIVVAEDDFSSPDLLQYNPISTVDGVVTNFTEVNDTIKNFAEMIAKASRERDQIKKETGKIQRKQDAKAQSD